MRPLRQITAALLLALAVVSTGAAAEPAEIPVGDLILIRTATSEKWYVSAHGNAKRNLLIITVTADGGVSMNTQPLPDKPAGDPDDPDDDDPPPPEKTLAVLVGEWADAVDDPPTRARLAAVYQFSVQAIDSKSITSVADLKAFQARVDTLVLGGQAQKWTPFLQKVKAHLDANVANDMAAYRTAWTQIASGLARSVDPSVLEHLLNAHEAERGQP